MDSKSNMTHSKESFILAISRFLERSAFYGVRSLLVLYMIEGSLEMNQSDAFRVYSLLIGTVIFAQIVGAVLGDLLIGNRNSILIGGALQAVGAFVLSMPSLLGLYIGLGLIVLGTGFYTPNLLAQFGKTYAQKPRIQDAGFSMLYLMINLGALLGTVFLAWLNSTFGWSAGFACAGVLSLVSVALPLLLNIKIEQPETKVVKEKIPAGLKVAMAIFLSFLFWTMYELSMSTSFEIGNEVTKIFSDNIFKESIKYSSSIFNLPLAILATVIWSYVFIKQRIKLLIAFLASIVAYFVLFFTPETASNAAFSLYILYMLFSALAELHLGPIVLSILSKYSNPRYLAIVFGLSAIPFSCTSLLVGIGDGAMYFDTNVALKTAIVGVLFASLGMLAYILFQSWSKKA